MTKSNYGEFFYRGEVSWNRYKFKVRFNGLRQRWGIKKATQ